MDGLIQRHCPSLFLQRFYAVAHRLTAVFNNAFTPMQSRSFIGIDTDTGNDLVLVQRTEGQVLLAKRYKNTAEEIRFLVGFIRSQCARPRICLKAATHAAMKLLEPISGIPDVEVVLISEAGMRMHLSWLPQGRQPVGRSSSAQADLLACCAERMP